MRRHRKILAMVVGTVALATAMAACSDPTNPAPTSSAASVSSPSSGSPTSSGAGRSEASSAIASSATATGGNDPAGNPGGPGATGNTAQAGQAAAGASGTLNLFMYQKPNGLFNPLAPASGPDQEVISLVYEALLTTDPTTGELVPLLADGQPQISPDAKTFTFRLKKNLVWSDGSPVTSNDVLFTYTRAADPNDEKGPFNLFSTVVGIDDFASGKAKVISGFSTPDNLTFVVKLTTPNVGFLGQIAQFGILPEHVVGSLPAKTFAEDPYFRKPTVGTGPFQVAEFSTDQFVHLTANPDFRYQIGVKDVFLKILSSDVATQQLQTGEIDATSLAPVDIDTVKGFNGVQVKTVDTPGFVRAAWNQSQKRFQDPRVKQAFLYGTDRKSLVTGALKGQAVIRNSVLGSQWQATNLNQYPYDPAKAKTLLTAAGWDSSQPVDLAWISAGNPDRDAAAAIMQNQLKNVGINIKLNQVQGSWFSTNVPLGKFDMVIYGGGDYSSNPANVIPITSCQQPGKGPNNGLYCDKAYQAVVEQANQTTAADARKALYLKASTMENEDPSQMWLYTPKTLWALSDKFEGFTPQPLATAWFQAWNWKKAA